jgi:hypothetical protein
MRRRRGGGKHYVRVGVVRSVDGTARADALLGQFSAANPPSRSPWVKRSAIVLE